MPESNFVFGSFNSASYSWCYKLKPINFPTPEKDTVSYEVPGRSGDLLIDFGSYKNVELTCEVILEAGAGETFLNCYDKLRNAIMVQNGYQRLEDSLYPGEYRMARAVGIERSKSDAQNGTATITFDAKPQRYLTSGETAAIDITTTAKIADADLVSGYADDIFNETVKTSFPGVLQNPEQTWLAWHVNKPSIGYSSTIKLFYPQGFTNTLTGGGNTYQQTVGVVSCLGSPLVGGTYSGGSFSIDPINDEYVVESSFAGNIDWVCFPEPIRFELWSEGVLIGEQFPDKDTLTMPQGVVGYNPLIKIGVSGAVNRNKAVLINNRIISLNTPATVGGSNPVTVTEVCIDCDTLNAYFKDNNVTYSLNNYVTLNGDFATFGESETFRTDSNVDSVQVIPRWWKI